MPWARNDGVLDDAVAREVDGALDGWRSKAVKTLGAVAIVVLLPVLLTVVSGLLFELAWPLRILCILLYLAVAAVALNPRWTLAWRVGILLAVVALVGVIQLATTQLAGGGRMSLLVLPLIALMLAGPRAGWWMVGLSLLLYLAAALLSQSPARMGLGPVTGLAATPEFWGLQGLRLVGDMLLVMILLTQFQALQRRTMIAERTALRKLEAETADRKRLEAEVAHVSEAERRRLGSELHDGLCQNLTAALLNCTALENRQAPSGAPAAAEVTRIRTTIEESIDMAYEVAHGLCPVDLDPEGLVPALEALGRGVSRRGIACQLQAGERVTVSNPDCALQLYRIASEALANAVKHAACSRIVVRLARRHGWLELSVSDDGKGLANETKGGLGLRIMAYRAGLVGGELTASGAPGQGTTVLCRVPDPEAPA